MDREEYESRVGYDREWHHPPEKKREHVIEFRSGSFFQNLKADRGGPMNTAQRFESKEAAESFMAEHWWILLGGGMAVPYIG